MRRTAGYILKLCSFCEDLISEQCVLTAGIIAVCLVSMSTLPTEISIRYHILSDMSGDRLHCDSDQHSL